ncbi:hypothetical protein LR48_Vigan09g044500 [Vigna angularis]|uniref:Uncharacterized protein n=1 Tax=Phaseolus angularis TaxID=3914 RepID=A0A0L9V9M7_PHAAN|nr:hypothetical protein LR48_Vigan09g044500 [Vigna angularis]
MYLYGESTDGLYGESTVGEDSHDGGESMMVIMVFEMLQVMLRDNGVTIRV